MNWYRFFGFQLRGKGSCISDPVKMANGYTYTIQLFETELYWGIWKWKFKVKSFKGDLFNQIDLIKKYTGKI